MFKTLGAVCFVLAAMLAQQASAATCSVSSSSPGDVAASSMTALVDKPLSSHFRLSVALNDTRPVVHFNQTELFVGFQCIGEHWDIYEAKVGNTLFGGNLRLHTFGLGSETLDLTTSYFHKPQHIALGEVENQVPITVRGFLASTALASPTGVLFSTVDEHENGPHVDSWRVDYSFATRPAFEGSNQRYFQNIVLDFKATHELMEAPLGQSALFGGSALSALLLLHTQRRRVRRRGCSF